MVEINERYFSTNILHSPKKEDGRIIKGALILSQCDEMCMRIPNLRKYFYVIERRAWEGLNCATTADIKLIEDLSTWEQTKRLFPKAILLDIGPADFIDTDTFKPLGLVKEYDGIQVSSWNRFKRHQLFIKGTALISNKRFLKLGHFVNNGNLDEITLRDESIILSRRLGANIFYPFSDLDSNDKRPNSKGEMNFYVNKAKLGILTTKVEGINRFKMECLSADIPVLVPEDTSYPTKKHINDKTGILFEPTPESLAKAIRYALSNYSKFAPRDYILKNTGNTRALLKLKGALESLCQKESIPFRFEDIYWDGRNQSLEWGKSVEDKICQEIQKVN